MDSETLVPAGRDWPVVLGIDPGSRCLGYGALVMAPDGPRLLSCGVIRAGNRAAVPTRLARIRVELDELLAELRPGVVAVETAFAAKNAHSALRLGEARGVVLACIAHAGAEVVEIAPAAAKKAVLGNGMASKHQVARMVERILAVGELPVPHDATDALALALAHVLRRTPGLPGSGSPPRSASLGGT